MTMSRAQLCNSLHALAQLQVPLAPTALAAYTARTTELAHKLNARDVAQLMHGWATLKHNPGQEVGLFSFYVWRTGPSSTSYLTQ